jgi:hypothetical protein
MGTVKRGGVHNYVVMNMFFVSVRGDNVSVLAFEKTFRQLMTDLVCFLRRNLTRFERLPDVIRQYVVRSLIASGYVLVLFFREKKLLVCDGRVAGEARHQFTVISFVGVVRIVNPVGERLRDALALVYMQRLYPRRRHLLPHLRSNSHARRTKKTAHALIAQAVLRLLKCF